MKHLLSALALGALASLAPAHAAGSWAATATKVVDPDSVAAVRKGPMQPGDALRVAVALNPHHRAELDALAADVAAGRARARLTPAAFLARHAPTAAEAQAVAAHLREAGFTQVEIAKNRLLVTATGTAANARRAFGTELSRFDVDGRDAYANTTEARVPAALAGIVHAVLGLQTVATGHPMHVRAPAPRATPAATAKGVAVGHDATDFPTLYGADGLPPATASTIAIFTLGDVSQTLVDLDAFTDMNGWPRVDAKAVPTGPASSDTSGVVEWNMDTQAALAAAGGQVKQIILYVGTDFSDASIVANFNAFVADGVAQVYNNSWGGCEIPGQASGLIEASDLLFEIAIAQGQTVAVSSGDSGSYQCGKAHGGQSYPAVSPWVLAIGGTTVFSRNGKPAAYVKETTWGCADSTDCLLFGGTGGGVSVTEAVPSWQAPVTGRRMRAIPDVAFDGDPASGLNLLYYGSIDLAYPIGGTSLSAPIFSGLWARIQSAHANALGFPGMSLYGLHESEAGVFHDVVAGQNGGYKALAGWDAVTGFGSFDAAKFNAFIDAHLDAFGRP
jgi:pseudomonalisin/xanthomonalisin